MPRPIVLCVERCAQCPVIKLEGMRRAGMITLHIKAHVYRGLDGGKFRLRLETSLYSTSVLQYFFRRPDGDFSENG